MSITVSTFSQIGQPMAPACVTLPPAEFTATVLSPPQGCRPASTRRGKYDPSIDVIFLAEAMAGLSAFPKTLPCKYFYDAVGSSLFDQICELPEYYPTRTETAILSACLPEVAARVGAGCEVLEYGSGSSVKIRKLLEALPECCGYTALDICGEHMELACDRLRRAYPHLAIRAVEADYTRDFDVPGRSPGAEMRLVFFPGSTIGNFHPEQAGEFLARMAEAALPGGMALIGVDLRKDEDVLQRAYNDAAGVTAAFNKNLLVRLRDELQADVPIELFSHDARWNEGESRIEMHLVAEAECSIRLGEEEFHFSPGESIHTECSYKYSIYGFQELAARAGWAAEHVWVDERNWFSVHLLTRQ